MPWDTDRRQAVNITHFEPAINAPQVQSVGELFNADTVRGLKEIGAVFTRKADLSGEAPWKSVGDVMADSAIKNKVLDIAMAPMAGELKKVNSGMMDAIFSLQRPGQTRELVSIPRLREASGLSAEEFDRQLTELVKSGKVTLHHHDMPFGVSEAERKGMFSVEDPLNTRHRGRTYYVGVVPKR